MRSAPRRMLRSWPRSMRGSRQRLPWWGTPQCCLCSDTDMPRQACPGCRWGRLVLPGANRRIPARGASGVHHHPGLDRDRVVEAHQPNCQQQQPPAQMASITTTRVDDHSDSTTAPRAHAPTTAVTIASMSTAPPLPRGMVSAEWLQSPVGATDMPRIRWEAHAPGKNRSSPTTIKGSTDGEGCWTGELPPPGHDPVLDEDGRPRPRAPGSFAAHQEGPGGHTGSLDAPVPACPCRCTNSTAEAPAMAVSAAAHACIVANIVAPPRYTAPGGRQQRPRTGTVGPMPNFVWADGVLKAPPFNGLVVDRRPAVVRWPPREPTRRHPSNKREIGAAVQRLGRDRLRKQTQATLRPADRNGSNKTNQGGSQD
jgi:hypothetical protein